MAEHTPTTEEVRGAAGDFLCMRHGLEDSEHGRGCPGDQMFDRWLAEHDRELIERCARVAGDLLPQTSPDQTHGYTMRSYTGATVAAAIRALSADTGSADG